jgi:hypothetical protein
VNVVYTVVAAFYAFGTLSWAVANADNPQYSDVVFFFIAAMCTLNIGLLSFAAYQFT